MLTIPAREAKNRFGHVLEESQHEDVTIMRNGKPYSVVMSVRRYRDRVGDPDPASLQRQTKRLLGFLGAGGASEAPVVDPAERVRSVRDEWEA